MAGTLKSGIFLASKDGFEIIIKVEGTSPFFKVTGSFNLSTFAKSGKVFGAKNYAKTIEEQPEDWKIVPINAETILNMRFESQTALPVVTATFTDEELNKWGQLTKTCRDESIILRTIMTDRNVDLITATSVLAKVRDIVKVY